LFPAGGVLDRLASGGVFRAASGQGAVGEPLNFTPLADLASVGRSLPAPDCTDHRDWRSLSGEIDRFLK
jgi:hypothetical protein